MPEVAPNINTRFGLGGGDRCEMGGTIDGAAFCGGTIDGGLLDAGGGMGGFGRVLIISGLYLVGFVVTRSQKLEVICGSR